MSLDKVAINNPLFGQFHLMGKEANRILFKENLNFRCNESQTTGLKIIQSKYSVHFSYIVLKKKKVHRN